MLKNLNFSLKRIQEIAEELKNRPKDENGYSTFEQKDDKGNVVFSFKYKLAEPNNALTSPLLKDTQKNPGTVREKATAIDASNPTGTRQDVPKTKYDVTKQEPIVTPQTGMNPPKVKNEIGKTKQNVVSEQVPPQIANSIRQNARYAVNANSHGMADTELFDDIDDETILKNRNLAEETIRHNLATESLKKEDLEHLPYLKDGLTMYYAGAEKDKFSAANRAKKRRIQVFIQRSLKAAIRTRTQQYGKTMI